MSKKQKIEFKYRFHEYTHEVSVNPSNDQHPYYEYFNTKKELSARLKRKGQTMINDGRRLIKWAELKNIHLPK